MARKTASKKKSPSRKRLTPQRKATPSSTTRIAESTSKGFNYCSVVEATPRSFATNVHDGRMRAILSTDKKWVNGTVLHYYFFNKNSDGETVFFADGSSGFQRWKTKSAEMDVVRAAFEAWTDVGIGLSFEEVSTRDDAEIRIGFQRGDGAWSYIGRDVLNIGRDERTMNFGWDLTRRADEIDTAIHEIGHTLGLPHEHQNPNAGIVWDEENVYQTLGGPPNNWDRQTTFHNIIRKIAPDQVQGSNWDHDSVMHYPFEAGMIKDPAEFQTQPLLPAGGLSARDRTWIRTFYPPIDDEKNPLLKSMSPVHLKIRAGQQLDLTIKATVTRNYNISTFGASDTVMVLFEDEGGNLRYRSGDDDSGEDYNANIRFKLVAGRRYVLRVRLYWSQRAGETAVMMW